MVGEILEPCQDTVSTHWGLLWISLGYPENSILNYPKTAFAHNLKQCSLSANHLAKYILRYWLPVKINYKQTKKQRK